MCDDIRGQAVESLHLPKGWMAHVRNAVLNVIGRRIRNSFNIQPLKTAAELTY